MFGFGRGKRIEQKLELLLERLDKTMAQLDDLISAVNSATNDLATEADSIASLVGSLQAQLAASPTVTSAQLASLGSAVTALQAVSTKLKGIGADPANPVPAPTPAPVTPPTPTDPGAPTT